MDIQPGAIGHIIQLAITPVFLLTTVCTKLLVLINRMSRIIDRTRVMEERLDVADHAPYHRELQVLYRRSHLINLAITLSTACGLSVCLIIAFLFIGGAVEAALDQYIACMFVAGVACLIGSFIALLAEIFIAAALMREQCLQRLQRRKPD